MSNSNKDVKCAAKLYAELLLVPKRPRYWCVRKQLFCLFIAIFIWCLAGFALAADSAASSAPSHATTIRLLGTMGGPGIDPNLRRFGNASLLTVDGVQYLIDAGTGVSIRLIEAGVQPHQIRHLFITHNHLDHTAGLSGLLAPAWFGGWYHKDPDFVDRSKAKPFIHIWGPPDTQQVFDGIMSYLEVTARIFNTDDTGSGTMKMPDAVFGLHTIPSPGDEPEVVYEDGHVKVSAVENTHFGNPPPAALDEHQDFSYSYRFDTPSGSVVFTGDTGPSEAVERLAHGAQVLVSEVLDFELMTTQSSQSVGILKAPNLKEIKNHMQHQHLSPEAVGQLASRAGVQKVILYHVVPGDVGPAYFPQFIEGVKRYFDGDVVMGTDGYQYSMFKN